MILCGVIMHEWALAEAVISSAVNFTKRKKFNMKEIVVVLGELQQIDTDVFDFALKEIMNTMGLDLKVTFKKEKALLKCRTCSNEWTFKPEILDEQEKESIHFIPEVAHDYVKCPECGSPDFSILKGRGVWLFSVKGD